jgi:hypothetical protein
MTREEIATTAERIRQLGVPDILNRWLSLTPEAFAMNEQRKREIMKPGPKEQALRETRNTTTRAMVAAVDGSKIATAPPPSEATKESDVKQAVAKKAPAKAAAKPKVAPAARKAAKPAAKENARTPVSGRPDGLRDGSKQAAMLDLALRQEGATEAVICKALGWKKCRVTLKRVCEKVGAKLEAKKNAAGETVYFATANK